MERYDENIVRLLEAYLTGRLDEEGRKVLEAWCGEDARNRAFFEQVCRDGQIAREDSIYAAVDEERAFRRFLERIRGRKRRLGKRVLRYAAVLMLPVAVALLWLWQGTEPEAVGVQEIAPGSAKAVLTLAGGERVHLQKGQAQESAKLAEMAVEQGEGVLSYRDVKAQAKRKVEYNTLTTGRGGEYCLVLSDGTAVYLNAETRLKYPVAFGDGERRVALEGEAYFEVATDSARAFVVEVNGLEVQVYGTTFDITTFYEGEVRTVLAEGSVGVRRMDGGEECRIVPGEMAVYDEGDGSLAVKEVDVALYTSWIEGLFKFEEERLEDIMETLSRWYDVEVFFYNDALRDALFTGDLRRYKNIGEHLRMLEMTTNVAFEVKGNTVFVGYRK